MLGRLHLVLPLVVLTACTATAEHDRNVGGSDDDVVSTATPPKRETQFASGTVDLTTYTEAGKKEWTDFEGFFKSRHTRSNEDDHWDALVERTRNYRPAVPKATLTNFVALKAYTSESAWFADASPPIDQDYKTVNTALRNAADDPSSADAKKALTKVEGFIKSATSGVNAMPKLDGLLHRRVFRSKCDDACVTQWIDSYVVGKYVREPSFLSASQAEDATCFFHGQAHFVYEANGGAHDVSSISDLPDEKEAIFPPGTVFKVTKIEKRKEIFCTSDHGWVGDLDPDHPEDPRYEAIVYLTKVR